MAASFLKDNGVVIDGSPSGTQAEEYLEDIELPEFEDEVGLDLIQTPKSKYGKH